jgi:hypothetical protein
MARPAQIVGFAPVGFLAVAVAAAVATVASGWTAKPDTPGAGYGVTWVERAGNAAALSPPASQPDQR